MNKQATALLLLSLLMTSVLSFNLPLTKKEAQAKYIGLKFIRDPHVRENFDLAKMRSQNRRVMLGLVAAPSAVVNINSVDET